MVEWHWWGVCFLCQLQGLTAWLLLLYCLVVAAFVVDKMVLYELVIHICHKHVGRCKRGSCSLLCCDQNNFYTGCLVPLSATLSSLAVVVVVSRIDTVAGFPGEA